MAFSPDGKYVLTGIQFTVAQSPGYYSESSVPRAYQNSFSAVPDKAPKGKIGNVNYFIKDADGHIVEIVQYAADGWTRINKGKFLPDTRFAQFIPHVGILVGDVPYESVVATQFSHLWKAG